MLTTRIKALLFGLLISGSSLLHAEDPSQKSDRLFIDFAKPAGLVDYYTSESIPDNAAQTIYNVDFRRNGNLSTRKGVSTYSNGNNSSAYSGPYTANFISFFVSTRSTAYLAEQIHDSIIFKNSAIGNVNSLVTTLSGNDYIDGVNWAGTFYIIGHTAPPGAARYIEFAVDDVRETTGLTGIPQGHFMQPHLDRLLTSGSTTFPLRVNYSDSNTPETFNALNTIDILGIREYDRITGLGPTILGNLPIYTRNTTRLLSGTVFPTLGTGGNTSVRVISDNIGCIHHRTIKNMNNRQYFYSSGPNGTQPGIYIFNGITVKEATRAARKFFQGISISTTPLPNGFVYKDSYCLNVATRGGVINTTQICIDDNESIRVSSGPVDSSSGEPFGIDMMTTYAGDARGINGNPSASDYKNAIFIYDYDPGKDFLTTQTSFVTWRYKTKDFGLSDKSRPKRPERLYVSSQYIPNSFTLTANYDFGRSSSSWTINSTTTYGQSSSPLLTIEASSVTMVNKIVFPQNKHFKHINFELNGSSYSSINYIDFYATPEPME